jgi:hypothetical protein
MKTQVLDVFTIGRHGQNLNGPNEPLLSSRHFPPHIHRIPSTPFPNASPPPLFPRADLQLDCISPDRLSSPRTLPN